MSTTNEGKLWGGRFAGGPSPELEALSRSTHFDWRLTPYDLAGLPRPRQRPARAPGCSPTTTDRRCIAGLDALAAAYAAGDAAARTRPTRTCTGRWSGCCSRRSAPSWAAGCAPGAAATTRSPPCSRRTCATTPAVDRRPAARPGGRARAPGARPPRSVGIMPGRTHLQHAQPVLLAHHLLAHAWPLLRDVDRLRDWDARVAADSPYGSGALAGSSLGLDPEAVAAELGFTGSSANSIDGTAARDFVAEFAFVTADDRRRPQPARRGDHPLVDPGVRLRHARTTPGRRGRASCRRRRTPTSPSSPAASPAG